MKKILVIGSVGQIGSELTLDLRKIYGNENIIASGRKTKPSEKLLNSGPFEFFNATNKADLEHVCKKYNIDTIINTILYILVVEN